MTSNGRVARLTALALATGTLVAAGAGTAGATATDKTIYTATGGGSVIHLEVNLPVSVPGIGDHLVQDLVITGSNVRTGSSAAAVTNSILGANGNVPVVSGLLDKSVTATLANPNPAEVNLLPDLSALGITGKLLALKSSVANPNVDGTVANSLSTITDLRINPAGNLDAVLGAITAALQTVVDKVVGTLPTGGSSAGGVTTPVTSTVTGLVDTLVSQVNALANNAEVTATTTEASDAIKAAVAQVTDALNSLPTLLSAKLKTLTAADTSLLHIGLIESTQKVTRSAGVVTSTSDQALTNISALGGLVTVDGLSSEATAALGNGVSSALPKAIGSSKLLHVNVADALTVDVTGALTAALGGSAVPQAVKDAVNGALAQVTGLLNTVLGATLVGPTIKSHIADPNHASSIVSAAELVVNPTIPGLGKPLFAKPLLDVQFVPTSADVVKGQAAVPPASFTPAKASNQPVFARTGANFGVTAPIALSLIGLAAVYRRRRLAQI